MIVPVVIGIPGIIAAAGGSGFAGSLVASALKGGGGHGAAGDSHYGFAALSGEDLILALIVLLLSGLGWTAYRGGSRWRLAWVSVPAATALLVIGSSSSAASPLDRQRTEGVAVHKKMTNLLISKVITHFQKYDEIISSLPLYGLITP